MKIHSIEVQGLFGYREHTAVELDGMPLVVAVGTNGSGKSALIVHSVLAALWGRFPTRTVEESISDGLSRGQVAVEFSIGARYRVTRTFARKGSGTAALAVRKDDAWEPVTEKGVREVTAKVTELLGMTADTAVMTWVAEQGDYGRFATAKPSERFRLLAEVYGLDRYGALLRSARERLRTLQEKAARAEGRVIELGDGLVDDDSADNGPSDGDVRREAELARAEVEAAASALAAHRQSSPAVAAQKARRALSSVRTARVTRLEEAQRALSVAEEAASAAVAAYERGIGAAEERYTSAVEDIATRAAAESSRIQGDLTEAEEGWNTLRSIERVLPETTAAWQEAQDRLSALGERRSALAEQHAGALVEQSRVRSESEAAASSRASLQAELAELTAHSECTTCGQHLSPALIEKMSRATRAALTEVEERTSLLHTQAQEVAVTVRELGDEVAAVETDIATATEQEAQLRRALDEQRAAVARREALSERIRHLRAALETVSAERDAARHRASSVRLGERQAAEQAHAQALAAAEEQQARAREVITATQAPSEDEKSLEVELAAAEQAAADEDPAVEARLSAAQDEARARAQAADAELGRRAEVARRRAEQAERIESAKKALTEAQVEVALTEQLVAAYSPGGIPSMILESVIAELSESVNSYLETLSGGELAVRIATARETSAGAQEPRVTVYVETGSGTRSYEALSGGQRFRVDLAVRLGLANVIARGTGTPVETFILDEGWGSLDEAGIRSTLNVLHTLSEEVTVLTVSHVDVVRDAFDDRIEVTATEGTSQARVVRG